MLALIYLGLAICVGERLCGRFYRFVSTAHRWATGALVGLLLSTGFTYLAARHLASANNPLLWGDILFLAVASIFLIASPAKRAPMLIQPQASRSEVWTWIILGLYCALACWMMFATLNSKDGRLEIGVTQWSDYGPNTAIVQSFAFGHNFPAEYPHWAGEPIRYHFLFYFLAGNLEFLGLSLPWSLNIISILTLLCTLALVIALGQVLFKSRSVGCIASALFFFHGTLNFIPFLRKQTSFDGALQAIYHLHDYLSSGYPYRGEDWGIWTQVVFINQRHLASSIGVFLVVLIFLFDRYLEKAKQRSMDRALAAGVAPIPSEAAIEPSGVAGIPAWHDQGEQARKAASGEDPQASAGVPRAEHWSPVSETIARSEAQPTGVVESPAEWFHAASDFSTGETQAPSPLAYDEQSRPMPETISTSEAEPTGGVEPPGEWLQAANYASAAETRLPDTVAYGEQLSPMPETISTGEARPPGGVEPLGESLQAAANEAKEPEILLGAEGQKSEARSFVEQSTGKPESESVSEAGSPQAPAPEPVQKPSRGIFGQLVYDNLVSGRGFIFSGLLLGALPYWNAPVFTAAAAVLAFLFVLFPCRRYMLGLGLTAAVVALPQVLALRSGNARSGISLIHWGYTLGNVPVMRVVEYLGWTFGLKWVLILVALLFFSWRNLRFFIAIFSLFLLTFCLQFSEEGLANHKFLNIWLVLANLLAAYGLWRLWHIRIKGWALPFRLVSILLVSPIILGGVIDFFPVHNASFIETNYTKDRLIDWIRAETKPDAVFLTDRYVNHPILLAGRKIFFGYTYFTWSAGYNIPKREAAYTKMFESKNAQQVFTLLKANGIDYVAYDDGVRNAFKNSNEKQVYAPNFKKAFEGPDYWQLVIYKVPENADWIPPVQSPAAGNGPDPGVSVFDGGKGTENGKFDFPRGLAIDGAGNFLVADTNNGRIQKFSPTGAFLSVIGRKGTGPGEFRSPGGLAVDSRGNIYVADVDNQRVQKLKPDGTYLAEWKGPDIGFYGPRDICVGRDDSIYVVDEGHARIVKFDSDGKVLVVWGGTGKGDGQFADATSVAFDGKTNKVYVADPANGRIEVFDPDGRFLARWPVEEWRPGGWPFQDIVIDSQAERLYASSVATDEVLVFDLTGKKIESLKPKPPDKLEGASSLALGKGKLYALNTYANHLSWIDLQTK